MLELSSNCVHSSLLKWYTVELDTNWMKKILVNDQTYHYYQLELALLLIHSLLPSLVISKGLTSSVGNEIVINTDRSDKFWRIALKITKKQFKINWCFGTPEITVKSNNFRKRNLQWVFSGSEISWKMRCNFKQNTFFQFIRWK